MWIIKIHQYYLCGYKCELLQSTSTVSVDNNVNYYNPPVLSHVDKNVNYYNPPVLCHVDKNVNYYNPPVVSVGNQSN